MFIALSISGCEKILSQCVDHKKILPSLAVIITYNERYKREIVQLKKPPKEKRVMAANQREIELKSQGVPFSTVLQGDGYCFKWAHSRDLDTQAHLKSEDLLSTQPGRFLKPVMSTVSDWLWNIMLCKLATLKADMIPRDFQSELRQTPNVVSLKSQ